VELNIRELRLGANQTLAGFEDAVVHRPGDRRAVHHLPRAEVGARTDQDGGVLRSIHRRGSHAVAGRDHPRLRPLAVVDAPLTVGLHRRVVVANRRLLREHRSAEEEKNRAQSHTHKRILHLSCFDFKQLNFSSQLST
jgi:hypothetical protein